MIRIATGGFVVGQLSSKPMRSKVQSGSVFCAAIMLTMGVAIAVAVGPCASLVQAAPGGAMYGLQFDGIDDYVTFGVATELGVSTFTLETWFRWTGSGSSASTGGSGVQAIPLIAKGRGEYDGDNRDMNFFLGIRATDRVLVADFEEAGSGPNPGLNHPVSGVTPIGLEEWHHAAATFDGTEWRLYLDGVLESVASVGRLPRADSIQHASWRPRWIRLASRPPAFLPACSTRRGFGTSRARRLRSVRTWPCPWRRLPV
jgi:hypothetical protein